MISLRLKGEKIKVQAKINAIRPGGGREAESARAEFER